MQRVTAKWSREELILCLDVYFRLGARIASDHPEVIKLSDLLRRMPWSQAHVSNARFRSPDAVHLKLQNFLAIDPAHQQTAMPHGAAGDRAVFQEFSSRPRDLVSIARLIRVTADDPAAESDMNDINDEVDFPEGRVLYSLHRRFERNRRLTALARKRHVNRHGRLFCEACSFDFSVMYGDRGTGFIEVHHDVPVSMLTPGAKSKLRELRLLCSNCHRMIHRFRPWLVVAQLRHLLLESGAVPTETSTARG